MINYNYLYHFPKDMRGSVTKLEKYYHRNHPVFYVTVDYDGIPFKRTCHTVKELKSFARQMVHIKERDEEVLRHVDFINQQRRQTHENYT